MKIVGCGLDMVGKQVSSLMQCVKRGSSLLSIRIPFTRCLLTGNSRTKLFIGGLSYDSNETVLKDAFGKHGEILEVKVICDHVSAKSRGYGFVQFTSEAAASAAIKEMDGRLVDGRNIRVQYAHKG